MVRVYSQQIHDIQINDSLTNQSSTYSRYWLANRNYDWRFYGGELTEIFKLKKINAFASFFFV